MMNKQIRTTLKLLTICFMCYLISGCLILMLNGPSQLNDFKRSPMQLNTQTKRAHFYAMRGLLDIFSTGMDTLAQRVHATLGIEASSLSYLEEDRLANYIIESYKSGKFKGPLILVGHSYGADNQVKLAKRLCAANIPVDLLITLDSTEKQTIPPNVNVFYDFVSSQTLMPWGNLTIADRRKTKAYFVNLETNQQFGNVNHLNIDKLPEFQNYLIQIIRKQI